MTGCCCRRSSPTAWRTFSPSTWQRQDSDERGPRKPSGTAAAPGASHPDGRVPGGSARAAGRRVRARAHPDSPPDRSAAGSRLLPPSASNAAASVRPPRRPPPVTQGASGSASPSPPGRGRSRPRVGDPERPPSPRSPAGAMQVARAPVQEDRYQAGVRQRPVPRHRRGRPCSSRATAANDPRAGERRIEILRPRSACRATALEASRSTSLMTSSTSSSGPMSRPCSVINGSTCRTSGPTGLRPLGTISLTSPSTSDAGSPRQASRYRRH